MNVEQVPRKVILDISAAQGRPDFDELARDPRADGVILKVSEGNGYVDPEFSRNFREALRVGLLRGFYHFAHPDRREMDAREEAAHFVTTVLKTALALGRPEVVKNMLWALDIEEARNIDKGPSFCEWVLTFCERVDELLQCRFVCGIYTGGVFWDANDGIPDDLTIERLRHRWLWIAAYVNDPTKYINMTPWRDRGAALHQRSGDVGPGGSPGIHYRGITANVVDTNDFVIGGDLKTWIESLWLRDDPIVYPNTDVPQAVDFVRTLSDTNADTEPPEPTSEPTSEPPWTPNV